MPTIIEITDLSAPELAVYTKLTEAQLRNKLEPEKGIFIAESPKVIGTALDAGCVPLSFLMERPHIEGSAAAVLARCPDTPVYTAPRETLQTLTGYALTRGVLCAMRRPKQHTVEELCQTARRVAVLEGIVDSTNIGAIFRSAAALGMDAVLLSPSCCDPLCRRAVRVSMGTVFQVPWARLGEKNTEWPAAGMDRLHKLGFKTAAPGGRRWCGGYVIPIPSKNCLQITQPRSKPGPDRRGCRRYARCRWTGGWCSRGCPHPPAPRGTAGRGWWWPGG